MLLGEGGGCLGSGCGRVEAVSNAEGWGRKLRVLRKLTDLWVLVGWDRGGSEKDNQRLDANQNDAQCPL